LFVALVFAEVSKEPGLFVDLAGSVGDGGDVLDLFLSLDLETQIDNSSLSILDTLFGVLEEFLTSLLTVDGLAGWDGRVFLILLLLLFLLLVFVRLIVGSGEDNGFGRGTFSVIVKIDFGVFEGLFSGGVKESGDDVVALSLIVHGLEVNPFLFGFSLETEDDSRALFTVLLLEALGLANLDLLGVSVFGQGFEVNDACSGGVRPGAVVEELVFFVFAEGFNFGPEATVLNIEIDLGSNWEGELYVSIVSGNILLVIEWSDKADLSLSAGSIDKLYISGNVDSFGNSERSLLLLLLLLLSVNADFSVSRNQSRYIQGVDEGETSGSRQSNGDLVLVVHLLVVEGLSVLEKVSQLSKLLGQSFDGVVVEGVEAFSSGPVDEDITFQLLGDSVFEVEDLSDSFIGEFFVLLLLVLLLLLLFPLLLVVIPVRVEFISKKIEEIVHAGNHGAGTNAVVFVSVDVAFNVVENGVRDQAVFASNVVDALGVSQVKSFDNIVGQVLVRVLGTKLLLGQHMDGGLSVLAEFSINFTLKLGSGFNGGFNSGTNLVAGVFMSKFGHTLEHACRWVGLHQVVDGSDTNLVSFSGVGVGLVEYRSGEFGVNFSQFVQRNDDEGALEVSHGFFSFKVGFENAEDLGVGHISKSSDVDLDFVAVFLFDGFAELLGHIWDVFFNDGLFVFGRKATKSVYGVTVVCGIPAYLSHTDEVGEGIDSRGVKSSLVDNFRFLYQFEEFLHVFRGRGPDSLGEGSNDLGCFFSFNLVILDPALDDHEAGSSSGFDNGITEDHPSRGALSGLSFSRLLLLFLYPEEQFLGSLFQLFEVHGADDTGQDGEAVQSVLALDFPGVLQLFSNLFREFLDNLVDIDVLGGLDRVSHVSDKVGEKRSFRSLVHFRGFLYPFFAAGDAGAFGAAAGAGAGA